MKALSCVEGKLARRALLGLGVFACVSAAKANLVFTEQVSVNEIQSSDAARAFAPMDAPLSLALGDMLSIRYEISRPTDSPASDADSVVYEQVRASVKFGDTTLFSTENAELSVLNLIGFYGISVSDFSGPLLDYLASSSPEVLSKGFLVPNLLMSDFNSAAGGSVFADGKVIGFQTVAYQFSGDLPSPVPEPSAYGAIASVSLAALALAKKLRRPR